MALQHHFQQQQKLQDQKQSIRSFYKNLTKELEKKNKILSEDLLNLFIEKNITHSKFFNMIIKSRWTDIGVKSGDAEILANAAKDNVLRSKLKPPPKPTPTPRPKLESPPKQKLTDIYDIHEELGSGAYSKVYKVSKKGESEFIALKELKRVSDSTRNEIKLLKRISKYPYCQKYMICLYGYFELDGKTYIATDYIEGKEFRKVIENYKSIKEKLDVMIKIAEAYSSIHDLNVAHLDIKPENIMLTKGGDVKIIDFGFSCVVDECKKGWRGTPYYSAPELLALTKVGEEERKDLFNYYLGVLDNPEMFKKADVYSYGVMLYLMFNNFYYPYKSKGLQDLILEKLSTVSHDASESGIPELDKLIDSTLNPTPPKRPTMKEIVIKLKEIRNKY